MPPSIKSIVSTMSTRSRLFSGKLDFYPPPYIFSLMRTLKCLLPAIFLAGFATVFSALAFPQEARAQTGSAPRFDITEEVFLNFNPTGTVDKVLFLGVDQDHHIAPILLPPIVGGNRPFTRTVTPDLPAGISIMPEYFNHDRVHGEPTVTSPRTAYTLTVTDRNGDSDSFTFHLTVVEHPDRRPPTFGASTDIDKTLLVGSDTFIQLPEAMRPPKEMDGMGMEDMSGTEEDLTYSLNGLPDGLTFTPSTLQITGSPTTVQEKKQYTMRATDINGDAAFFLFHLTVETDTQPDLPPAIDGNFVVGENVFLQLPKATGGNMPVTYEVSPSLPAGLSFDSETRIISGSSATTLTGMIYTLTVRDIDGDTDTTTFTLTIREREDDRPDDTPNTVPDFGSPDAITWTFTPSNIRDGLKLPTVETGDDGTLTYVVTPLLSSGLTFDAGRHAIIRDPAFDGFPLPQGDTTYTLTVTDGDGDSDTFPFITVAVEDIKPRFRPEVVIDEILVRNKSDRQVVLPVAVDDDHDRFPYGNGIVTNTIAPSTMPPGLLLRPNSDGIFVAIIGRPTAVQERTEYIITARDEDGDTATYTFHLTVVEDDGVISEDLPVTGEDGTNTTANQEILPRVTVAIAYEVTNAVRDRVREAFSGNRAVGYSIKGGDWKQFLSAELSRENKRAELPEIHLSDFAFSLTPSALASSDWDDSGYYHGRSVGFRAWGRGYYRNFDIEEDITLKGGVTGGIVGVDTLVMSGLLLGVSGNLFSADMDFRGRGETALRPHKTGAWVVNPYLGWQPDTRILFWATGGYGLGDACESVGNECPKRDINLITIGGGGSALMGNIKVGAGRVSIDIVGDVALVRISEDFLEGIEADAGTARLGLEFGYGRRLGFDGNFGGDIRFSYRSDFGDLETESGVEAGGGFNFSIPRSGLRINASGRALISGTDKVEEYGFSGDILWSYNSRGTGAYVNFSPQWGATNDRRDELWERGMAEVDFTGNGGHRYNFEAGYGVPLMDGGIMTVFARSEMDGETVTRLGGVDFETAGGFTAGYEAVSRSTGQPEHRGYVRFSGEF